MAVDYKKVKKGYEWIKKRYPELVREELFHHGVKGQKWGVRNGPPYPLDREKSVEKIKKGGIVKTTISGHEGIPKQGIPNSITDHVGRDGKVDKRAFNNK